MLSRATHAVAVAAIVLLCAQATVVAQAFGSVSGFAALGMIMVNIGIACLAIAHASSQLKYAPGRGVLLHASADSGERAAIVAFGAS